MRAKASAKAWRQANPERAAELKHAASSRRRARKRNVACDPVVTLADVIMVWGDACYLCGVTTDPNAPPRSRYKAELEHVIPLSKGGAHDLSNLRCACYPCNAFKGAHRTAEDVQDFWREMLS
jgi:5-methylcytosine-specific restriction endonuclease McrA